MFVGFIGTAEAGSKGAGERVVKVAAIFDTGVELVDVLAMLVVGAFVLTFDFDRNSGIWQNNGVDSTAICGASDGICRASGGTWLDDVEFSIYGVWLAEALCRAFCKLWHWLLLFANLLLDSASWRFSKEICFCISAASADVDAIAGSNGIGGCVETVLSVDFCTGFGTSLDSGVAESVASDCRRGLRRCFGECSILLQL